MEETAQLIVETNPPAAALQTSWEISANIVSTIEKKSNCLSLSISVISIGQMFHFKPTHWIIKKVNRAFHRVH